MFTEFLFEKHNLTDLCMYALDHVQECRDGGVGWKAAQLVDLDSQQ